jgi:integrase
VFLTPLLTLFLAGNPQDIDDLIAERDELYANARRPGTVKTYSSNVKLFMAFCTGHCFDQVDLLPKYVFHIVSLYIAFLCLRGLAYGTIHVYFYSIRAYYLDKSVGMLDISKSYLVSQVLHAIKLHIGDRPKAKLAITLELLSDIFRMKSNTYVDIRDWAAFALAFFGLFRRSEILGLRWRDIRYVRNGIVIHLGESKTDPFKRGMFIYVGERLDALCPCNALALLHRALDPAFNTASSFVFPSSKNSKWTDKQLTGNAFSKRVKHWIGKLGLDPKDYAGHSLRRGGATALFRAGIPSEIIQAQGRWRSDCYKKYLEMDPVTLLSLSSACSL